MNILNLLTELADLWEIQAASTLGSVEAAKRVETLRECADALKMLLSTVPADTPAQVTDLGAYLRETAALLASARVIAQRQGQETAWDRFDESIAKLGISAVTARTYKVLPSDTEDGG